jgi:hypothetical protein
MRRWILLALIGLSVEGCSTYAADRYSVSADNITAIKQAMATHPGTKLGVAPFTAAEPGRTEFDCRLVGPVKTPDGQSFEAYIRKALVDELQIADAYAETGTPVITGNLNSIDMNSWDGKWNIVLAVSSSTGAAYTVTETFNYESSFSAEAACQQGSQAFQPAVQDLIRKVVSHPDFPKLVAAG